MSDQEKQRVPWFTDNAFDDPEKGVEKAREAAEDEKARRISRFWLPEGTKFTKKVMFLDEKPLILSGIAG